MIDFLIAVLDVIPLWMFSRIAWFWFLTLLLVICGIAALGNALQPALP